MKKLIPILLLLCSSCFLFEDEQDEQNTNLTLSLHSAGVTTVNLNVSPEDSLAQFTFELTRDDSTVQTLSIQSDTLIKDTGLNPNTTYTYRGYWMNGTKRVSESDALTITTMDTTSHNFTWEIDTLGEYGSYLKDVWVVGENNIWAVGALSIDDSTLNYEGHLNYNIAHWNGTDWTYQKVCCSGLTLNSIFYFSENDIWVCSGTPWHWNGEEWINYHLWDMGVLGPNDGGVTQIWGTSSSNLYFAGRKGSIVHYDGNEFVKIESGSDIELQSVSGSPDGDNIYTCGFDINGTILINITEGISETLYFSENHWSLGEDDLGDVSSVSVFGDTAYFVTMIGLYKLNIYDNSFTVDRSFTNYQYNPINVALPNDILLCGGGFQYAHYNGSTWDFNSSLYLEYNIGSFASDLNGDIAVIVGFEKSGVLAVVCRGYR